MNFGVSGGGYGLIGILILFGGGMIVLAIVATVVLRVVRGRDDRPTEPGEHASDDDYIL